MSLYLFPKSPYEDEPLKPSTAGPTTQTLIAFLTEYAPWREFSKSSAIVGGEMAVTSVAFSDGARHWGVTFDFRSKVVSVRALGVAKRDSNMIGATPLNTQEFEDLLAYVKSQNKDFAKRTAESLASYCVASGSNGAISEDSAEKLFHEPDLTTEDLVNTDEHFDIRIARKFGKVYLGVPSVMADNNPKLLESLQETKRRAAQYPFSQAGGGTCIGFREIFPKANQKPRTKKKKSV